MYWNKCFFFFHKLRSFEQLIVNISVYFSCKQNEQVSQIYLYFVYAIFYNFLFADLRANSAFDADSRVRLSSLTSIRMDVRLHRPVRSDTWWFKSETNKWLAKVNILKTLNCFKFSRTCHISDTFNKSPPARSVRSLLPAHFIMSNLLANVRHRSKRPLW